MFSEMIFPGNMSGPANRESKVEKETLMRPSLSRGGSEPAAEAAVVEHGGRGDWHGDGESAASAQECG